MTVIENKYEIKQKVYLVTDEDQKERLVTGLKVCSGGEIIYQLSCGTSVSDHYDFEISPEKRYIPN